jgi:hypothetical protein
MRILQRQPIINGNGEIANICKKCACLRKDLLSCNTERCMIRDGKT